ncbi:MAG: TetR/AcrR family transcriptional regulator [Rikenellaceae bacterium]|nr:TetR/AcrR family transcriptional regulator [Rikenellaceae bacterium]
MNGTRVLENTAILFSKYGIKTVSMDLIADRLKMSKKTLYEMFVDKEDIVNKCLYHEIRRFMSFSSRMEKFSDTPLEKLIIQSVAACGYVSGFCPAFYKDIQKYGPACEILDRHSKELIEEHRKILNDGKEQGYLDSEMNPDIIMRIFRDQMNQIKRSYGEERISAADFLYLLTTVLKGICTEKGTAELARISTKWTSSGMMEKLTIRENI